MKLYIPTIRQFLPAWNLKIFTESDALEFCELHNIIFRETDLIEDPGEYRYYRETSFIFLNLFIKFNYRAWVIWHEIGHFIMHPTTTAKFADAVTRRRVEQQANIFAGVALMPDFLIRQKTLFELKEEFNYPLPLILLRKKYADENYSL